MIGNIGGSLVDYFVKGSIMMWPLLACSIVGLVFMIERGISLHRVKVDTAVVFSRIRQSLVDGDLAQALKICDEHPGPISDTLRAGLMRYGRPPAEIEKAIESVAQHELSKLERGLWVLATVANAAPLIGFLGTVTGMIRSFEALAEVGLGNPKAVASGISEALITTAMGLAIALPVQAAFNYYSSRVGSFALDMETSSTMLLETFSEIEMTEQPVQA